MSSNKKKNNINSIVNSGTKSIDSFFSTSTSSKPASPSSFSNSTDTFTPLLQSQLQSQYNTLDNNIIQNVDINQEKNSRENVLKTLLQHKLLYSHTEIKNKIDNLSEDEMTEIFKIIKNNNEKYSTNKNGIFINLSTLKKNTIQEISNFLYFCDNNNKAIIEEELERAKYKEMIND